MVNEESLRLAGYGVGLLLILAGALGVWVNRSERVPVTAEYVSTVSGISFRYPIGAGGYVATVRQGGDDAAKLRETIVLTHETDTEAKVNGEGPPAITVTAFENDQMQFPLAWANQHKTHSNISLSMGDISEAVVGGANAIRYRADGLYAMDTAVVAHGGYIFVLSGAYIDDSSPTLRDFGSLLASVRFLRPQ